MITGLTPQQAKVLAFIEDRMRVGRVCPSFEEMKVALGYGSKHAIHDAVTGLEERGHIRCLRAASGVMRNRAIVLLAPTVCPHCGNRAGGPACLAAATREQSVTITRSGAIPQQARA